MTKRIALAILSFLVLDLAWLGCVANGFYRQQLGPIAMTGPDGALAPIWAAAAPVYVLMAIGIAVFVVPRAEGRGLRVAAGYGALFGWILFGVYDFTNYSTLKHYPLIFAVVDTLWGGVACATTATIVAGLTKGKTYHGDTEARRRTE